MKRVRVLSLFVLATAGVCVSIFGANEVLRQHPAMDAVVVPSDNLMIAVVNQPDCPLKFEKAQILRRSDGKRQNNYQVRNIGQKAINSFSVGIWNSDNTGDVVAWPITSDQLPLLSGEVAPRNKEIQQYNIIPFSETVRKRFGVDNTFRGVVFFMVVEISFADGTQYSATPQLDALELHLGSLKQAK